MRSGAAVIRGEAPRTADVRTTETRKGALPLS
ncbi:hypothetical protein M2283_010001 [Streptomyces pseudovenezuelae]|uniref:Uncharacterized protein n=1 Tax=Streptomyces pseudovenezuelae TaxID=67350 RepID=A0ABT6M3G8_9ACTN|nr:hypothetical protein [Streptomyces pseudovenezuelae]